MSDLDIRWEPSRLITRFAADPSKNSCDEIGRQLRFDRLTLHGGGVAKHALVFAAFEPGPLFQPVDEVERRGPADIPARPDRVPDFPDRQDPGSSSRSVA